MKTHDLEPIKPQDAVDLYLTHRKREVTQATLNSHRSRLQFFTRWCAHNNITNLNTLTGRKLHQYRLWRRTDGDLAPTSEKTQMDTIRVFIDSSKPSTPSTQTSTPKSSHPTSTTAKTSAPTSSPTKPHTPSSNTSKNTTTPHDHTSPSSSCGTP